VLIRMSKWSVQVGLEDIDHRERWYQGVRDVWYAQPGLLNAHVLGRPGTRDRMTFSVWESEEHYRAFIESGALQHVIDESDDIYAPDGHPVAEEWAVLTEDWPLPVSEGEKKAAP
jgi:heme-degrading monooxygenase HmoA